MPSVLGLLEAREKKVREEVARLREEAERVGAALDAAECALRRLGDALQTVAEALAEAPAEESGQTRVAVAGALVPQRAEGIGAEVLPLEYQQIVWVLALPEAADGLRVKRCGWAGKRRRPGLRGCVRG